MFIEDQAYHEQKKFGRRLKWLYVGTIALFLICLWMLSGCQSVPQPLPANVQPTKVIYVKVTVPDELLVLNEWWVEPTTWGEAVDAMFEARGALDLCNADKELIRRWNDVKAD